MPATVQDIARRVRLSPSTVSQVLGSRSHLFKPATRRKVMRVATEMGYQPNTAARAARTGRFNAAALILDAQSELGMIPAGMLTGIDRQLAAHGLRLTVAHVAPDADICCDVPVLRESAVDGLFIDGSSGLDHRLRQAMELRVPALTVRGRRDHNAIAPDEYGGMKLAIDRLVALGHRRLTLLHGRTQDAAVLERIGAFQQHLAGSGLAHDVWQRQVQGSHSLATYTSQRVAERAELAAVLRRPGRPTAVICGHPMDAILLQAAAYEAGLRVPEELSLVTFSDFIVNHALPITTLVCHMTEMGSRAVDVLLGMIENPDEPVPTVLWPYHWVDGVTTRSVQA